MRYNNRLFPHPVLGIGDDIIGEFSVELVYKSDKDFISLSPTFKLVDKGMKNLILTGKAYFIIQVYCRSTMYREIFKTPNLLPDAILIPSVKLNGDVEVDFFICSETSIKNYSLESFNPDYNNSKFFIDRGDILAYGGKGKFVANKSPEELKSISSLIRISNSEEISKPMYNEYEGQKIQIMLCQEDYENYQLIIRSRVYVSLIHSIIVLPALLDALNFLDKKESEEFSDKRWYKALKEYKSKFRSNDSLILAQKILDLPNMRSFKTIINLMEEA